ncbi:cytochrome c oxidase assembly protein [Sinomonas soli]
MGTSTASRLHAGIPPRSLWGAAALPLAIAAVTAAALGSSGYRELSRDFPGMGTALLSTVLHAVALVASTLCVGGLFQAAFLRGRPGPLRPLRADPADARLITGAAAAWFGASVALVAADGADSNGFPVSHALDPGALAYLVQASYLPGAWIVTGACALVVLVGARMARHWAAGPALLAVAFAGILSPVLVAQVLVGPDHDFGGDAAAYAVPAESVFFGVTVVLAYRLLQRKGIWAQTMARYRRVAAVCWLAMAAFGGVEAWFFLAGSSPFASVTGWLLTARFVLLAGLGALQLRLRGLGGAELGAARTVLRRTAAASAVVIAAMAGIEVALSRVPPPNYFAPTSVAQLFFGYDVDAVPTPAVLALDWRLNTLFAVLSAVGAALYLVGVGRLRRRGDRWPVGRTVAWLLGWLCVVLTTSSGLGKYADASFSLHMMLHMSLNMLCPVLLVLGGPFTLALRATSAAAPGRAPGPHEWVKALLHWPVLQHLNNPLWVFAEFIGSYYVLYFTPIFEQAMRYHWAHQLFNLHLLVVGYFFYSLVIGVDKPPRPVPHLGKLGLLLAAMPFHAFFGVIVMTSTSVIAQEFYQWLARPWWPDLHADQYAGGGIAWAAGEIPLLIVVLALLAQWTRQDRRETTRIDRHLDSGLDESFEAYNEMLGQLADRRTPTRLEERP